MARIALASLNRIAEQEISPTQIQVNRSRIRTMGKVRTFKIALMPFDFDMGYMFNACFVADGDILVLVDHLPGKGEDLIYAYDLHNKRFVSYAESYTERTLNGESKVVVNKDGRDIIVF